jgi:hypothetical protein
MSNHAQADIARQTEAVFGTERLWSRDPIAGAPAPTAPVSKPFPANVFATDPIRVGHNSNASFVFGESVTVSAADEVVCGRDDGQHGIVEGVRFALCSVADPLDAECVAATATDFSRNRFILRTYRIGKAGLEPARVFGKRVHWFVAGPANLPRHRS